MCRIGETLLSIAKLNKRVERNLSGIRARMKAWAGRLAKRKKGLAKPFFLCFGNLSKMRSLPLPGPNLAIAASASLIRSASVIQMSQNWSVPNLGYDECHHAQERGVTLKRLLVFTMFAALLPLTGCPYYVPAGTVVTTPASFDRSFSAAAGAMSDEGLAITVRDPASGTVVGNLNGMTVTAGIQQQPNGSVVVRFNSADARDPTLLQRISRSYDRRMGR
jgi:hypothetical protein